MRPFAPPSFWAGFYALPPHVQRRAEEDFKLWCEDPLHPRLGFKKVPSAGKNRWSVKVGYHHRALGVTRIGTDGVKEISWYWIGTHEEYNNLV